MLARKYEELLCNVVPPCEEEMDKVSSCLPIFSCTWWRRWELQRKLNIEWFSPLCYILDDRTYLKISTLTVASDLAGADQLSRCFTLSCEPLRFVHKQDHIVCKQQIRDPQVTKLDMAPPPGCAQNFCPWTEVPPLPREYLGAHDCKPFTDNQKKLLWTGWANPQAPSTTLKRVVLNPRFNNQLDPPLHHPGVDSTGKAEESDLMVVGTHQFVFIKMTTTQVCYSSGSASEGQVVLRRHANEAGQ